MQRIAERVCGLDVHRDTVMACVRVPGPDGTRKEVIQQFGTMTADLLALREWLQAHGVSQVAMESTGVLWKPVYYILEESFEVLLVNAAHIKHVPGRKTDVLDCAWIAELLEHGLLQGSFVPPPPIRALRDLTRYRKCQVQERAREVQRLHKVLQDAGIKLSSVATDIMGVSGRRMIEALIEGVQDADALAELAKGRLRKKLPLLRQALAGRFREPHGFMAAEILAHIDYLEEALERVTSRIGEVIRPFAPAVELLRTIPGVDRNTAHMVVAEVGVEMKQFPSAGHLASWAGMCPPNNESAGKHRPTRGRKGNRHLRAGLVEAALAASRTKDTYLSAQYHQLVRRRGHKKAVVGVGHSILVAAYHMLSSGKTYQELGGDFFEKRNRDAITRRCIRQLERLGLEVTVKPKEHAA